MTAEILRSPRMRNVVFCLGHARQRSVAKRQAKVHTTKRALAPSYVAETFDVRSNSGLLIFQVWFVQQFGIADRVRAWCRQRRRADCEKVEAEIGWGTSR